MSPSFKGSRFVTVGNVTIGAMAPEARDLLDKLCESFKKSHGKDVSDVNGYQALYWTVRWSDLIEPKTEKIGER